MSKEDQLLQLAMENDAIEERSSVRYSVLSLPAMTAEEALELYKSRDELFKSDKTYLGNGAIRVQTDEAADAKIFIEFVALIIRNKIYTSLKDAVLEEGRK